MFFGFNLEVAEGGITEQSDQGDIQSLPDGKSEVGGRSVSLQQRRLEVWTAAKRRVMTKEAKRSPKRWRLLAVQPGDKRCQNLERSCLMMDSTSRKTLMLAVGL